ncbi:phage late control D family protein [Sorangium sp. So ce1000]|uniref:phage late control D family protein n=1 Tax=Sorangium sp. So ce1000 TaxID=3133325 RepID=UPI003F6312C9
MGIVSVTVAGKPLPDSMSAALARAEVDQELNLPSTCAVEVGSVDFERSVFQGIDLTSARIGDPVVVGFGMESTKPIFEGRLGALEMVFGDESAVELQGYDALYRLQFGTTTRTFERSSDTQIATRIARDNGLDIRADDSGVTYPYVIQADQSDFAFLSARAARIHFELFVTGRTLYFRRSIAGQSPTTKLRLGVDLTTLTVRARALKQGSRVTRVGWDPKKKQSIVATVSSGPASLRMGGQKTGYELSAAYAASPVSAMDPEILDQKSARAIAEATYEADIEGFIKVEASATGNPALRPGVNVEIEGIGDRFSGLYYVTAAKHIYTQQDGYTTNISLRRTGV